MHMLLFKKCWKLWDSSAHNISILVLGAIFPFRDSHHLYNIQNSVVCWQWTLFLPISTHFQIKSVGNEQKGPKCSTYLQVQNRADSILCFPKQVYFIAAFRLACCLPHCRFELMVIFVQLRMHHLPQRKDQTARSMLPVNNATA